MTTAMVEARGVRKNFGVIEILKGIDLRVEKGSVTCLIGPSGSGKTTFLRCINHLEKVTPGASTLTSTWLATRSATESFTR